MNNRKTLKMVSAVLAAALCLMPGKAGAREKDRQDAGAQYIPMEATAYCYGTARCDGNPVRSGICAGKPEWYGKLAVVYENEDGRPGKLVGFYECLDTGGQDIRDGKVLDIYIPDEAACREFGRKRVLVMLVDGEG